MFADHDFVDTLSAYVDDIDTSNIYVHSLQLYKHINDDLSPFG